MWYPHTVSGMRLKPRFSSRNEILPAFPSQSRRRLLMLHPGVATISYQELMERIGEAPPDNESGDQGFALINVLSRDKYRREHIPNSINIPEGLEDEYEERFEKDKEIVVYCGSSDCIQATSAAHELAERGFAHVFAYEGGLREWKEAGNPISFVRDSRF